MQRITQPRPSALDNPCRLLRLRLQPSRCLLGSTIRIPESLQDGFIRRTGTHKFEVNLHIKKGHIIGRGGVFNAETHAQFVEDVIDYISNAPKQVSLWDAIDALMPSAKKDDDKPKRHKPKKYSPEELVEMGIRAHQQQLWATEPVGDMQHAKAIAS